MLTKLNTPEGQDPKYLFVKKSDSPQVFKVTKKIQTSAAGQMVLSLGISPVDEDNNAMLNPVGQPDVKFHSRTFTSTELSNPEFDELSLLNELMEAMIEDKLAELAAIEKIKALAAAWSEVG